MVQSRLKNHLEDLQLTVTLASHSQVTSEWKHHNHITVNNCLYYFLEGEGSLRIGHSAFHPQAGDLYILPAGERISYSTSHESPFRLMFCHFNAYVGQLPLFQTIDTPLSIQLRDHHHTRQLFDKLIQRFRSDSNLAPVATKAALFELLSFIWDQEPRKPTITISSSQKHWNNIVHYIESRTAETLSVPQIAAAFNYSPKYFFRYFKSVFGISPHQYIVKVKMEKAKHFLITTDLTTARIANELGLERAHFSRMFLGYTDMTPQRFRAWKQGEL
ncbi:AraC family transcriptional regulator [Cohnella endophytica]|uniref:AraC family transcriptional regulator n=1 Tax=Cohnella endophytica TaxID=2419778 RepID=A0A494Y2Q5_9BACL|nr:AraC family transcriptional regulator [Cohnella endophytica]RKP56280.1 AraC family transcriptional regulator [Cohnella endophytica]